jgi:bifunctional DNA-binding transcriptional regulator/antitoxin component of YhaV-PrlF toxin-antitoxin module
VPFVKLKDKGQLTLPAEIRREQGDLLDVEVANGKIVLTKAVADEEDVVAAVREGLEEYRAGQTLGPFESMEEFEEYLRQHPES